MLGAVKQTQIVYPQASALPVTISAIKKPTPTTPTTFAALTAAAAALHMHLLRDGEVVLYRRQRSRVWQCKYKLFTGKWVRISTRKTVLEHAVRVATELYDEARYRERMGLAPVQKSFAEIARVTLEELRRDLAAGTGKKIYADYISIIERYFVPFFGERHLHTLTHQHVGEFERWRNHKMGKTPKSSTLMNFASAFSRVCSTAIQRGWISEHVPLPKMSRRGAKGTTRPAFAVVEVAQLRVFMGKWEQGGMTEIDRLNRPLLCDYVNFLLLTGMRHGTESMNIKWQHCEWYESEGVRYLRVWVSGKTGGRYLIAKHEAVAVLARLHAAQKDIAAQALDKVMGRVNHYLFRNAACMRPKRFNGMFERLVRDAGLLTNSVGERRTLYSLRHTYATAELLAGTDIHTLAKQMGTSVLMLERHYSKLTATMAADRLA